MNTSNSKDERDEYSMLQIMHAIGRHYNNLLSSYLNGLKRVEGDHINIFICISLPKLLNYFFLISLIRVIQRTDEEFHSGQYKPNNQCNCTWKWNYNYYMTYNKNLVLVKLTWKDQVIDIFSYIEVNVCSNSPEEYTASIFRVTKSDSATVKMKEIHSFRWKNHYCTV